MRLRQSDLKEWHRCPLAWKYSRLDHLPEEQGGSSIFGSILHDTVLYMEVNADLPGAIERFNRLWLQPDLLDPTYQIDYYERGRNWKKFSELGPKILSNWWSIIQWEADHVLAREHYFEVPIGDGHTLAGTADKVALRFHAATNEWVVLISDYKTNAKTPTYDYLEEDLQFSAYAYASTREEFWANLPGGRGPELFRQYERLSRRGEWVQLQGPKRMDAGPRTQRHYNRLTMAVNAMAESVAMRIFVPTITGESCRYCAFRKPCGLPEIPDD
jgi:hypothetical protein